ncbi:MAG: DUF4855 domain-containing protein [Muribaculaceae bacterium]
MKTLFVNALAAIMLAFAATSCGDDDQGGFTVGKGDVAQGFPKFEIRDLALIYQGGAHRIDWTKGDFSAYITHKFEDGSEDWLFDGFLFLEFKDGKGRQFAPGYEKLNARRAEWEWYLDRLFESGKSLDALDQAISEKKQQLGDPGFRHKIILTIMVPIVDQKDWGELDGRRLDFSNIDDREAAARWFIDQLVERFAKAGYKNLDLTGLYWIAESTNGSGSMPQQLSPYIHSKGLKFVWIPWFKAPGHDNWQALGFDMVYLQPNYFFYNDVAPSRVNEAVNIAKSYNLGLEFECDENFISKAERVERFFTYLDTFERRSVFSHSPIAYYTGSSLLRQLAAGSMTDRQRQLIDRLARNIITRRTYDYLLPTPK